MSPPVYHTRVKILTEIIINLSSAKVLSDKSRAALRQELEEAPESLNKLGEDIKKYKDAFKELSELQESLNAQLTREKFDQKKAASLLDTMVKILGILEVKLVRPGKNHSDSKDRESIVSTTSSNESSNSKKSPKPGPFTNTLLPSNIAQGAAKEQGAKKLERQKHERDKIKKERDLSRAKEHDEARAKHMKTCKTKDSETKIRRQLEKERAERRDKESKERAYDEAKEKLEKKWKQETEERRHEREQEWKAKKAEIDIVYDKDRLTKDSVKQAYDKAAGATSDKVTEQIKGRLDYQKSAQNEVLQKAREQDARAKRDQLERSKKEATRKATEEEKEAKRRQEAQDQEEEERDRYLRERLREASIRARRESLLRMHQHQSETEDKIAQQSQVTYKSQKKLERAPQFKQEMRVVKDSDSPKLKTAARRKSDEIIRPRPANPSRRASDPESLRRNTEVNKMEGRNAGSNSEIERKDWEPYKADRAASTRPPKVTFAYGSSSQQPSGPGQSSNIKASTIYKSQKNRSRESNQDSRTSQVQKNIIPTNETEAQKQARYRAQAQKEQEDYIAAEGRDEEDRNSIYEKMMVDARIKGLAMASKVRRLDWNNDEEDQEN